MAVGNISSLDDYYSNCHKIVQVGKGDKDFSKLKLYENRLIIKNIWNYILETSKSYSKTLEWNILSDNENPPEIMLSMNPYTQAGYVPRCNIIKYNFFGFFLNYIPLKDQVISYPLVLQIGRLLHEFDHYLYCKSNDLIHTRRKYEQKITELRALKKEIRFLKDIRGKHNENKYWEVKDGQFKERPCGIKFYIHERIYECKAGIEYLNKNNKYDEGKAKKLDFCHINKFISVLNADKCDGNKGRYKYMKFPFNDDL